MILKRNVLTSNNTAREQGLEPNLYLFDGINKYFDKKQILELFAILDFKIWSKGAPAVTCFFSDNETKNKFKVNVFRSHKSDDYKLDNKDEIDFATCPINKTYRLEIKLVNKMPKLLSCEITN